MAASLPRRSLPVLAGLLLASACAAAQAQSIPKRYQPLYHELESRLSAFEIRLPARPGGKPTIRAAALLGADCQRGESMLGESQREATLREMDALKLLGAGGIVLQVCYPLLTPGFRDPQPFVDYYANLANAVRSRGMKLLVEHNCLLPSSTGIDPRPYYKRLTKRRFERERFQEVKTILLAVQPDYLTLVSEPRVYDAGLTLAVRDWKRYVEDSVQALAQQLGSFPTLLGAGSGLWSEPEYVEAFAAVKSLSYIDLHLYPLAVGGEDMLGRLLAWPDRIRAIDPAKRIVMSELWLNKAGAAEGIKSVTDPNVIARNVYGFWAPLDEKLLRVVAAAAREKSIEWVAPFWSRYFFAYLSYDDPLTFRLKPLDLLALAGQRAAEAIAHGKVTDTGLTFRGM